MKGKLYVAVVVLLIFPSIQFNVRSVRGHMFVWLLLVLFFTLLFQFIRLSHDHRWDSVVSKAKTTDQRYRESATRGGGCGLKRRPNRRTNPYDQQEGRTEGRPIRMEGRMKNYEDQYKIQLHRRHGEAPPPPASTDDQR